MGEQRKKIWIDRFQTRLFLRIGLYFVLYQIAVWSLFVFERTIFQALEKALGPGAAANGFLFALLTVIVLGFLFIYDAVRFAHRIVGPLYRFRKTIQSITAGEEVDLVRLRQADFLTEMRDDINDMLKVLEQRGAVNLKPPVEKKEKTVTV